jgi:hypothetical protein
LEESKEQKEKREFEIQSLKTTIATESSSKDKEIKDLVDISN